MLITSGFNFDGYTITKYSGYISGDDAVSMDRPTHGWFGGVNKDVGADLLSGLSHIRRNALAELKEAAYALGCNAVIGVDFDYLTLDPETVNNSGGTLYLPFLFAVTANGNAVVIEKNARAGLATRDVSRAEDLQ
ncbi:heavy metal-binding domain-containing protein [Specibacter cremeus]|uniref:heavy metal-binding domain-containing protein n=1 Tax=Specibacter cremeus TaxID=1629051 RepID=UPI001F0BA41D|nr:heavy metal-binding domain-containing protein [Specibacter cremeus]